MSWPLFFFILVMLPPLDRAAAGPGDEEGYLSLRANQLRATCVANPEELQRYFFEIRRSLSPSARKAPVFSGGLVVFDPAGFSGWTNQLVASTIDGVTVYPMTLTEDPVKRDTLFYNEAKELIAVLPLVPDVDPFAWLTEWNGAEWVGGPGKDGPDEVAPSSVCITFALLPVAHVTDLVLARHQPGKRKNIKWAKRGSLLIGKGPESDQESIAQNGLSPWTSADADGDGLCDWDESHVYGADGLNPDTDHDGLTDGEEVFGWKAWDVTWRTNRMQWVEKGPQATWIGDWAEGSHNGDRVAKALSKPIRASLGMDREMDADLRVSTDGYVCLGRRPPAPPLAHGVNLPLPWPGLDRFVAVFWDELELSKSAGVWIGTDDGHVVVTWTGARLQRKPGEGLDFQMDYSAADGSYTFRYRACPGLRFPSSAFCTAGIQSTDSAGLARVVFNRVGFIKPGMTIRLAPAMSSPLRADTDGDGVLDGDEARQGCNPARTEDLQFDWDGDGLTLGEEMNAATDPHAVDTDGDGFTDAEELLEGLNPLDPGDAGSDLDQDGLSNEEEWCYGTDLRKPDSDGDQTPDAQELIQGSDPADASDGGMKPDETMFIQIRMDETAPALNSSVFRLGDYRCRGTIFKGSRKWASFLFPLGRTYPMEWMPREGFVESPVVTTEIRVNMIDPTSAGGSDMWVCPPAFIDGPRHVFGVWSR